LNSCSSPQTIPLKIGEVVIEVEVADEPEERQLGLMHRDSLPENYGMLFVFDQEQQLQFWMKNTKIPLSIAYISKDRVIKEIHHMQPLTEKTTESRYSVLYALEVNQGFFAKQGIFVGDQVDFTLPR